MSTSNKIADCRPASEVVPHPMPFTGVPGATWLAASTSDSTGTPVSGLESLSKAKSLTRAPFTVLKRG